MGVQHQRSASQRDTPFCGRLGLDPECEHLRPPTSSSESLTRCPRPARLFYFLLLPENRIAQYLPWLPSFSPKPSFSLSYGICASSQEQLRTHSTLCTYTTTTSTTTTPTRPELTDTTATRHHKLLIARSILPRLCDNIPTPQTSTLNPDAVHSSSRDIVGLHPSPPTALLPDDRSRRKPPNGQSNHSLAHTSDRKLNLAHRSRSCAAPTR